MTCAELDDLIHPYLDGELLAEDRVPIERHVEDCARCRELVAHERAFKEQLRARLKAKAHAPAALEERVRSALDRADLERPRLLRAGPVGVLLAAATLVAYVAGSGRLGGAAESAMFDDVVRSHVKNLPVEVGGTRDDITVWMRGKVPVPVHPPRFQTASLVGARLSQLASRDAGQILYRIPGGSVVTVYVFDASGWEPSARAKQVVDGREVYFAERAGYTVALYRDRGVGYALASDLDEDALVRLVAASLHEASP
jgi:anti-sigma factor RsiW